MSENLQSSHLSVIIAIVEFVMRLQFVKLAVLFHNLYHVSLVGLLLSV